MQHIGMDVNCLSNNIHTKYIFVEFVRCCFGVCANAMQNLTTCYLPFQNDVYRMFDTIARIHVSPKIDPNRIMSCEMLTLQCLTLPSRVQCRRSWPLALVMVSVEQKIVMIIIFWNNLKRRRHIAANNNNTKINNIKGNE